MSSEPPRIVDFPPQRCRYEGCLNRDSELVQSTGDAIAAMSFTEFFSSTAHLRQLDYIT